MIKNELIYFFVESSIIVMPVVSSPDSIVCVSGAAPRHLGNKDGWILIAPLQI